MTEQSHADDVLRELPDIPAENIYVEPARRGTAGSLALAAAAVKDRRPDALMASLHADAYIEDDAEFRRTLSAAFSAADQSLHLVLMGIKPSSPSTQLGYIEAGEILQEVEDYRLRRVTRFVEKPDLERARRFVASGRHFWNPGVFVWRVDVILEEFLRLQPAIHERIEAIASALGTAQLESRMAEIYPSVPVESIDVGIMERSDRVAVIPAKFGWSDVGSWGELLDILPRDEDGNVSRGTHLGLGTRNSLVFASSRPVATVGLEGMIVVETPDVVLVCPRDRVQDVKKLVERLALEPDRQPLL
jgi:mannose-1-phosphate guanylyltransferase